MTIDSDEKDKNVEVESWKRHAVFAAALFSVKSDILEFEICLKCTVIMG